MKVLPNLDVVVTGSLAAGEKLLLSAYAEQTADRVWTISSTSLLAAVDAGRQLTEFTELLASRAENELPAHWTLSSTTSRAAPAS